LSLSESIRNHDQKWPGFFASQGYRYAELMAAGVEGTIYRLGDETIAKVWARRQPAELRRLQGYYDDLAQSGLPFLTPQILSITEVDGIAVTFDRELPGKPLQNELSADAGEIPEEVVDHLVNILKALASVPATENMRQMAVIDEQRPFWQGADNFSAALTALLNRRVVRFGNVLRRHVQDFDDKYDGLLKNLAAVDVVSPAALHGDLFPENILVDKNGRLTAVLDFGFLSSAGDPRMDAAITAVITNMYGQHARRIAAELTKRFCADLGYPREILLLYRAAYAVATSNFLTEDGSDGHFAWCVDWLNDPLLTGVLGPAL
jgi:hypothetical protein